jgi:hypothetical protein
MAWLKKGTWLINKKEFNIPVVLKSQIITQVSTVSVIKPTWFWAGHLIQCLTISPIGLVRLEDQINVSIRDSSLFRPQIFEPNYQLKFYKADWIDSLKLTLFEDSMPLNFSPEPPVIDVPSQFASQTLSTTIPITATSTAFLAARVNRKKLIISNNSNQDLFVDFDATASIADHTIKIPKVTPGGFIATYELDQYTGVVSGIWAAAGTGAALVKELVA